MYYIEMFSSLNPHLLIFLANSCLFTHATNKEKNKHVFRVMFLGHLAHIHCYSNVRITSHKELIWNRQMGELSSLHFGVAFKKGPSYKWYLYIWYLVFHVLYIKNKTMVQNWQVKGHKQLNRNIRNSLNQQDCGFTSYPKTSKEK